MLQRELSTFSISICMLDKDARHWKALQQWSSLNFSKLNFVLRKRHFCYYQNIYLPHNENQPFLSWSVVKPLLFSYCLFIKCDIFWAKHKNLNWGNINWKFTICLKLAVICSPPVEEKIHLGFWIILNENIQILSMNIQWSNIMNIYLRFWKILKIRF